MRQPIIFYLSTILISRISAGGGAPPPPKKESNLDDSKPIHQNIRDTFYNETLKPSDYNPNSVKSDSEENKIMSKLGSITDAHSPTYSQDNPFPRPFWPQNVKFQGKLWALVMFSLWSCIAATYIYIKVSGRDYATLFPEGVEKAKRISQDSRSEGGFVKKEKREIHEITEENESALHTA